MQKSNLFKGLTVIAAVSAVALIFLFWLIYFAPRPESGGFDFGILSLFNATFNFLAAICLVAGFRQIKAGNQAAHKKWMVSAFVLSSLFLVSYIVYHTFHGDTKFGGEGGILRAVYFFILISHIALSVVALPMVLATFYLALSGAFPMHRRVARVTFPLWLYISVTGVCVYVLNQIYTH